MQLLLLFSGSTCVSLMTYGKKIFLANVGDSRAIILRTNSNDGNSFYHNKPSIVLKSDALTRDHKPDDKLEAERIYANGGRIDTYRDSKM